LRGPRPLTVELNDKERALLERLVRRASCPQWLLRRIKIVLEAATGANNEEIGRRLQLKRDTVRMWRARWVAGAAGLRVAITEGVADKELLELIAHILSDEPRPGAPSCFEPEQIAQIIAVGCEDPAASDRPVSHWTPRELADEVIKRGIVPSISPRSVGRFLKGGGSQTPSESLLAERDASRPGNVRHGGRNGV
jgi:transposase